MRTYLYIAMILIVTAGTVFSQTEPQQTEDTELKKSYLYQWTDDKGVVHITDGLGNVPDRYRGKALTIEQTGRDGGEEVKQGQQGTYVPPPLDEETIDEGKKAEWQRRVKDAQQRLTEAEQRYRDLDQKRIDALGKGSPATGNLAGRSEAEQIQLEMQLVQKEIDDIRHELDVVIPDEAQKAEVPPGWLRE